MGLEQLKIDSLTKIDGGKVGEALKTHLQRAAQDCMDRPADGKARTVTLQIDLVPVLEDDGSCSEVKGQFKVASKVPVHRTRVYSFGARRGGMLVYNDDAPDNFAQGTLLNDDDED